MSASSFRFYGFLSLFLILRIAFLAFTTLPLDCEEAQYWCWGAESISWGYFSKPPLTSWLMTLMTTVGNQSAFWVRSLSPVFHFGVAWVIYAWALSETSKTKARLAALLYFTLPGTFFSSILMTTDVPLLLMSSMSLLFIWKGIQKERLGYWMVAGVFLGLALLSKYIAAFIPISLILYASLYQRRLFKTAGLYYLLLAAFAVILPHLIWQVNHGFTTIEHTLNSNMVVNSYGTKLNFSAFFEYVIGQFALFGPFLMGLLVTRAFWRPKAPFEKFNHCLIWPLFITMCLQGLLAKVNLNWGVLTVLGVVLLCVQVGSETFLKRMIVTNTTLGFIGMGLLLNPEASMQLFGVKYKGLNHYQLLQKAQHYTDQWCKLNQCHLIADHRCVAALARFYGNYASAHKWYRGVGGKDYFEWVSPYKERNDGKRGLYAIVTQRPIDDFGRFDQLDSHQKIDPNHTLYLVTSKPGFSGPEDS
jgi:4-amino-4-deoxy-L-arabinose transferase-like glycosyltransferase